MPGVARRRVVDEAQAACVGEVGDVDAEALGGRGAVGVQELDQQADGVLLKSGWVGGRVWGLGGLGG